MTFENYLRATLPGCRYFDDPEEKEDGLRQFLELLESGEQVLIMGKERTGKSTLVRVLRARGYNVIEPDEMAHVYLSEQIPFENMVTDLYRDIE